jgi:predicted nucleic acid-binding protein
VEKEVSPAENLFVDTSAWVALVNGKDENHQKAAAIYPSLLSKYRSVTTTNLVLSETYILLLRRVGYEPAIHFIEKLRSSPRVIKVISSEALETRAIQLLHKYSDQEISYTDAVSFALMENHKIRKAFCFDRHFIVAGFENVP